MLHVKEVFLEILVSLTTIIANDLFVPKFLFNEHAFMWKKDREFFYLAILVLLFHQYQNI